MAYSYNPVVKNLQKVTHLNSESIREQYNACVRLYPKDFEGIAMILHIINQPNDVPRRNMLISHLKELHKSE